MGWGNSMGSFNIIKYTSNEDISFAKGNTQCQTKPTMTLNYDINGIKGVYGFMMNINPNSSYEYQQIFMKHDAFVDIAVGGELTLDNQQLTDGDIVWLTTQGISGVNGLYFVRSGAWEFYRSVTSNLFIDLGARSVDKLDGDLSREIITQYNIDFSKVGIYTIYYYSINSQGILSTITRKVKITELNASLVSTDSYAISDYRIIADVDSTIFTKHNYKIFL